MSREDWLESKRNANCNKVFDGVKVLRYSHTEGNHSFYDCECLHCGKEFATRIDGVKNGHTTSCGCLSEEWMHSGQINRKHGLTNDRAYWLWAKIKSRCYNPKAREFPNYGGRGVKMCDDWLDPEKFIKWAYENGYDKDAPKGRCTLDRIDVNGDYDPENCRWVTNKQQQNNRRNNLVAKYNGETHTAAEWSEILNIPYPTMRSVIKSGKPIEKFLVDYAPRGRG